MDKQAEGSASAGPSDAYDRLANREHKPKQIRDHSEAWSRFVPLGSVNDSVREQIESFCESKRITLAGLEALGTRVRLVERIRGFAPTATLVWAYPAVVGSKTIIPAVKYRNLERGEKKAHYPSTFLAAKVIGNRDSHDLFVVEGETDAARVFELIGDVAAIMVLPAGALTFKADWLAQIPRGATIHCCHDADKAGDKGAAKVAELVGGAVRVKSPAGDWCDWDGTREDFIQLVSAARPNGRVSAPAGGGELLDDIRAFITRFVVLPSEETADMMALWVLHTWLVHPVFRTTGYVRLVSAAPSSGKSLLFEVLELLVCRGWLVLIPSSASLFRKLERDQPTVLLDEVDQWPLEDRKDALGALNAGYRRNGPKVPRWNHAKGELEEFGTYGPKAFAGLDSGDLPPTLLSRSITVRMEKMRADEHVEDFDHELVEHVAADLCGRCSAWAGQHAEELTGYRPAEVEGVRSRARECWRGMLSIAEVVGGDWTQRARRAAHVLAAGGDDADEESRPVMLLTDIRTAFGHADRMWTEDLLQALNRMPESPWGSMRRDEGINARGLANMLRPFRIKSRQVRIGDVGKKGYLLEQFEDAFERHLPTPPRSETSETSQPQSHADVSDVSDDQGVGD
jgi:hypothetical protein